MPFLSFNKLSLTSNFKSRITPSWNPKLPDLSAIESKISAALFAEGYLKPGIFKFFLVPVLRTSIYLATSFLVWVKNETLFDAPLP